MSRRGAQVVLVGVVLQLLEATRGLLHAAREHLYGRFDAGLERDELPHVGGKIHVVLLEVALPPCHTSDDFLYMREVFVELVASFRHFDEAFVGLVHLREGVQHCVCHVVKEARGVRACGSLTSLACTTPMGLQPHLCVPVTGFEKEDQYRPLVVGLDEGSSA